MSLLSSTLARFVVVVGVVVVLVVAAAVVVVVTVVTLGVDVQPVHPAVWY